MKKDAWLLTERMWDEFDMGFNCVCGQKGLYLDYNDGDPEICPKCGRTYTLTVLFEVEEKEE